MAVATVAFAVGLATVSVPSKRARLVFMVLGIGGALLNLPDLRRGQLQLLVNLLVGLLQALVDPGDLGGLLAQAVVPVLVMQEGTDVGQQFGGHLAFPDRGAGQAPGDRHPVRGGDQVQLQAPVPARMGGAVAVSGPARKFGALDGLAGGAARHRGGVDQPHLVVPRRRAAGQVIHRRRQQRRRGLEPLVVARLMRQVGEQVPEPGVAHPQPVMLRPRPEQHLGHRQAHQLGIGQPFRLARPAPAGRDHVVVDLHIQCGQEGVQVWRHNRSWMPSSLVLINAARRADLNQE